MKHDDGYTLFELLVVIGVMALVSALAWPNFNTSKRSDVLMREAQSTVLNILRDARSTAIANNSNVSVVIDPQKREIIDKDGNQKSLPDSLSMRVVFTGKPAVPGVAIFQFFPDGTSTGGDVELTIANEKSAIAVNWLTGEAQSVALP